MKELIEVIRKADSVRSTNLFGTRRVSSVLSLAIIRSFSNVFGFILSYKTNGILVFSGGRVISFNVGYVIFGDFSFSVDYVIFGFFSINEGLMFG